METVQLGVGAVRWQMPSTVDRLQVVEYTARREGPRSRLYALAAGLPPATLDSMGLDGRTADIVDTLVDRCLERQGCTLEQVLRAAHLAWSEVMAWYRSCIATEEARGNSAAPPGLDTAPTDPTPTTLTDSEPSAAPSSP
jgi:hypothetical protein